MSANNFRITGKRVNSYDEFLRCEEKGVFKNILYYPRYFNGNNTSEEYGEHPPKILSHRNKTYVNVSFKDTIFRNVRFLDCVFERCLLIGSRFIDCEFINCRFSNTNTHKSRFEKTLIDPDYFKSNFDLELDTNIAIDLYRSLYKNLNDEMQSSRARQSLYMMYRAENAHLDSQLDRGKITCLAFFLKKLWHIAYCPTAGYGLKLGRVPFTFALTTVLFSYINYIYRNKFFDVGAVDSFYDSMYFTVVTLTTLGYGDILPTTEIGRIVVSGEAICGIVIVSLFLTSINTRVLRT